MASPLVFLAIVDTFFWIIAVLIIIVLVLGIRILQQYETGVRFRLGKFHDTLQPGLRIIQVPITGRTLIVPGSLENYSVGAN